MFLGRKVITVKQGFVLVDTANVHDCSRERLQRKSFCVAPGASAGSKRLKRKARLRGLLCGGTPCLTASLYN